MIFYSINRFILILYRKEKKRKMDETTFQMYDRIVSTLFNDGVVKFGRILTLFVSARKLCKKYPDYTQRLWCIYHRTVDSLNFPNEECRIFPWRRPDMFKWGFFSVVNIESCNLITIYILPVGFLNSTHYDVFIEHDIAFFGDS